MFQKSESVNTRVHELLSGKGIGRPHRFGEFDACVSKTVKVDKYQQVRFESNRYSVPSELAFGELTLKAYVEQIVLQTTQREVARHPRCYARGEQILDPLHYLRALTRRPAALDHAAVFRDWRLPAVFAQLRSYLEQTHGPIGGRKQYTAVLALLMDHPLARVVQAIEQCLPLGTPEAVSIRSRAEIFARTEARHLAAAARQAGTAVDVPQPDLRQFDRLLSKGETNGQS